MPDKLFQPYLLDLVTCETLMFQMVPMQLEYNPETSWNVVASPGRNSPLYQYNGAEDTLSFSLSWYADEESREDVMRKVKWIEALAKNDGYDNKPHRLKLMFGKVFADAEWIMFSCQEKLSMFNREFGMLPCLAMQEITLKRILTVNRSLAMIKKIDT